MTTKYTPAERKRFGTYVSGFFLSVALTFAAYAVTEAHVGTGKQVLSQPIVLAVLFVFAVAQLVVQLLFFLHLGEEKRPRWRLLTIVMAAVVVLIVVLGSIWIMKNLNYAGPPTVEQDNKYLQSQGDL